MNETQKLEQGIKDLEYKAKINQEEIEYYKSRLVIKQDRAISISAKIAAKNARLDEIAREQAGPQWNGLGEDQQPEFPRT